MTRLIVISLVLLAIAYAVHARRRPPTMSFDDPKVVALIEAARRGNAKAVAAMAAAGVDLDARGKYRMTPVLWAVVERDARALRTLLEAGADPDLADEEGHVPLEWAVQYPEPVFMELLLAHGADPNAKDHNGHPVTFDAVDRDHWEYVERLLAAGADMEATSRGGDTLILYLAIFNQFEQVAKLIERGANYLHQDSTGGSVAWSVQANRIDPTSSNAMWRDRVKVMLEERGVLFPVLPPWEQPERGEAIPPAEPRGSQPALVFNDEQLLALVEAARRGDAQTVSALVKSGVSLDAKGRSGMTPVFWATVEQETRGLQLLLEAGADPDIPDQQDNRPIHWAVRAQDTEILKALLAHGADREARDFMGDPVLMNAIAHAAWAHVDLLLEAGANPDAVSTSNQAALLLMASAGEFERVARLIERGADYRRKDPFGRSIATFVRKNRAHPKSAEGMWRDRVKALLEERGVRFPAAQPQPK